MLKNLINLTIFLALLRLSISHPNLSTRP
jgi:hypothetical protein